MTIYNQFQYGSYVHPASEVNFDGIQRQVVYSQAQRANILRETWNLRGKIIEQGSNSQAAIMADLAVRRTAYSVNGQSAGFAGSPFWLDNGTAIGGIVVTDPISHDKIQGAEGVTFLHYRFSLQKDSFLSNQSELLAYKETVTFSDINGAPLVVWRTPAIGAPIPQIVSSNSWFDATQTGSATSRNPGIQPEDMLWPSSLLGEVNAKQVTYTSPPTQRGQPLEYTVNWTYKYRQVFPFTGGPHARG